MKYKKILVFVLSISVLLYVFCLNASAMNTGFTTCDMEPDIQQTFLSNNDLALLTTEPEKQSIVCFDVNDDGLLLIGSGNFENKTVSVYTPDGVFKYGYKFTSSGSFGVEWDVDNIIIYFVRSDVAALVDSTGEILELKTIENTIENNSYWNHSVYSEERTVNGNKYVMKNNMGVLDVFATSYSQIVRTDSAGNSMTVYDVGQKQFFGTIIVVIFFAAAFVGGIISIILFATKTKKTGNNNQENANTGDGSVCD